MAKSRFSGIRLDEEMFSPANVREYQKITKGTPLGASFKRFEMLCKKYPNYREIATILGERFDELYKQRYGRG